MEHYHSRGSRRARGSLTISHPSRWSFDASRRAIRVTAEVLRRSRFGRSLCNELARIVATLEQRICSGTRAHVPRSTQGSTFITSLVAAIEQTLGCGVIVRSAIKRRRRRRSTRSRRVRFVYRIGRFEKSPVRGMVHFPGRSFARCNGIWKKKRTSASEEFLKRTRLFRASSLHRWKNK